MRTKIASIIRKLFPRENEKFINELSNELISKYNGNINEKNVVVALLKIMNDKIRLAARELEQDFPEELYIDDPNDIHKISSTLDYVSDNNIKGNLRNIERKLVRARKNKNKNKQEYDDIARMYTRDINIRENSNYMEIDDVRGRNEEPFRRAVNPPGKKIKGDSISR